jgi:hypothetical protein
MKTIKSHSEMVLLFKELITACELFCRSSLHDYDSASDKYTSLRYDFAESLSELYDDNERLKREIESYAKEKRNIKKQR